MITKEDIEQYQKTCGGDVTEKDIPVLNALLKKNQELNKKKEEFSREYSKLSTDLQLAYKILGMEHICDKDL